MRPNGIILDGVSYPIDYENGGFETVYEPGVVQQADIAGASRPAKNARPDLLTWRWDDWSGGEGQSFIDTSDPLTFIRYKTSSGPLDVSTRGQLKIGRTSTQTEVATNGLHPAYLVVSNAKFYLMYTANSTVAKIYERASAASWSDKTSTVTGLPAAIIQVPAAHGSYIYAGFRGGSGEVRRIPTNPLAASAQFAATPSENIRIVDNRAFGFRSISGTPDSIDVYQTASLTGTLPLAFTKVYTADGASGPAGTGAFGKDVYFLQHHSGSDEPPRLHVFDGTAGREVAAFQPDFRVTGRNAMAVQNGVVFVGGYLEREVNTPALAFYDGNRTGIIDTIREGTAAKITAIAADGRNGIVMVLSTGETFRYDMTLGGLHQFITLPSISGYEVRSIASYGGIFIFAYDNTDGSTTNRSIRVAESGVTELASSTEITGSTWDFDFPDEEKLLTEIEIHHAAQAGTEKIAVSVLLDDTTTITTDSAGAALETAGGTRTKFTLSGPTSERIFRRMRPSLTLTKDSVSPTVYSVTFVAEPTATVRFYDVTLDLSDRPRAGFNASGSKLGSTLETLIQNAANRVVSFTPLTPQPNDHRGASTSSQNVRIVEARIHWTRPGEGNARLRLKVV